MALNLYYQPGLIKTKYNKPEISSRLIPRQRLSEKLNRAFTQKVTVVSAPAGYGKSTAVLEWINSNQLQAAWVSLDTADNDPVVFWQYILAALDDIAENISLDTSYVFSSLELFKTNIHLSIIIDRFSAIDSDIFLVLDDFHTITEPRILESISYLVNYLPPQMHLILISRSEPNLELARLKLNGELTRLTMLDLRFQPQEIVQFFKKRGFNLDDPALESIDNYSEGWAAALVAVAMSMENEPYRERMKQGLGQYHSQINQYFLEEVYNSWPEEKQAFFTQTSILDMLCGDLCDAVTGSENSNRVLERLNAGNSFLIPLDEKNGWYRYHHIFGNFLRSRLTDSTSCNVLNLHEKAALWFERNGYPRQAIEHFLTAERYEAALKLIEEQSHFFSCHGDFETIFSWINRLPEGYSETSLRIAQLYSAYYSEIGNFELSNQWINKMEDIVAGNKYCTDDAKEYDKQLCNMTRALMLIREGAFIKAYSLFNMVLEHGNVQHHLLPDYLDYNLCDIYFYRCPVNRLTALYGSNPGGFREMISAYRTNLVRKNPGYAPLAAGEYLYETDHLEESMKYLLSALEEATQAGCPGALVPTMVHIAKINKARGDMAGAFKAVEECETRLQSINKKHWNYLLKAFQARLYLESGDDEAAESWFESCKLGIYHEITRTKEFELLVYARFLIARGSFGEAAILLQRLLAFAESLGQRHSMVEILNLLAIASFNSGEKATAMEHLRNSIDIGMEEGYIRSFIDEMNPMEVLLGSFTAAGKKQKAYVEDLYRRISKAIRLMPADYKKAFIIVPKELTPQEMKVLKLLADGCTNHQIAEQLNISLSTVKAHNGSIYSKLQVKTRVQCINEAKQAGLI